MAIDENNMLPFYQALIENTRDIVVLLDEAGIIQFSSPSVTTIFDYQPDELAGTLVFDRVHPEDLDRAISALYEVLRGNEVAPYVVRFRHKNGSWKYVEIIVHPLGQNISEIMLTARDVTEFEANATARRLVDASFEAAFNASSAINSISISETGELVSVNDGWVKALGWSREEAIGKTSIDLNVWGSAENRERTVKTLIENGGLQGYRTELLTKSGELCVVLLDATFLDLPIGTRLYFSAQDITEMEKTEETLRQSQRLDAIGHLTGGIAHDFNNLLSVIMGHAELARQNLNDTNQVGESVDAIFRASVTGANLIQQLLSFSRKQRLSPICLNLVQHIETLRPLLQTTVAKDIELEIDGQDSNWLALIDPHLLDNALHKGWRAI
jgi:PAS domain S-box-containing protein